MIDLFYNVLGLSGKSNGLNVYCNYIFEVAQYLAQYYIPYYTDMEAVYILFIIKII